MTDSADTGGGVARAGTLGRGLACDEPSAADVVNTEEDVPRGVSAPVAASGAGRAAVFTLDRPAVEGRDAALADAGLCIRAFLSAEGEGDTFASSIHQASIVA